jgi:putative FmdB family regulatory protein
VPIYVYACGYCGARRDVFVRRAGDPTAATCERCGASDMARVPGTFAVRKTLKSTLEDLDPVYRKRIDAAIANTPEADPMRLLAKTTPLSAAEAPGDPIDF